MEYHGPGTQASCLSLPSPELPDAVPYPATLPCFEAPQLGLLYLYNWPFYHREAAVYELIISIVTETFFFEVLGTELRASHIAE